MCVCLSALKRTLYHSINALLGAVFAGPARPGSQQVKTGQNAMDAHASHKYVYYASGRKGCASMSVTLDLRARQDLLAIVCNLSVAPQKEKVVIEVSYRHGILLLIHTIISMWIVQFHQSFKCLTHTCLSISYICDSCR